MLPPWLEYSPIHWTFRLARGLETGGRGIHRSGLEVRMGYFGVALDSNIPLPAEIYVRPE
jgi:hypothetical protein